MTGRQTCHCGAQVVEVRIDGSRYLLDWPWSPTGDVAVTLTVAGGWLARYAPVGETLRGTEKRYRRHDCQPPAPSITEPRVPAEVPPEQVLRWKQAVARAQRGEAHPACTQETSTHKGRHAPKTQPLDVRARASPARPHTAATAARLARCRTADPFETGARHVKTTDTDEQRLIKPIPTRYSGVLFRSKLEARYAAFFDYLSIRWAYEIQGFDVDGVAYLPDFFLPEQWLWCEVKPAWEVDPDGVARWRSFVAARGERGVLLTDLWPKPNEFLLVGGSGDGGLWEHEGAMWWSCPNGYHYDVMTTPRTGCELCRQPDLYWVDYRIREAFDHARSYRFERG